MSEADTMANLERQQRSAALKGEQAAKSRLTPFFPRDPYSLAMLEEVEAAEVQSQEDLAQLGMWIAEAERRAAESRAFAKDHEMMPILTKEQVVARDRQRVIDTYGYENLNADYEANPGRVLAVPPPHATMFTPADPSGRTPGGFSGPPTDQHGNELPLAPQTYYPPATHFPNRDADSD